MTAFLALSAVPVSHAAFYNLDIDGNGKLEATTDGLLLTRYLLGVRGAALVSALPASAALGIAATDWDCTYDNVTGLMWEVKTGNDRRSSAHTYT